MTERTEATVTRHAQTLTEVRRMHEEYRAIQEELMQARRTIDQQANMIQILQSDKDKYWQEARIYQRKLIRLCSSMQNIGMLSQEAMDIMRSSKEYEEQMEAEDQRRVSEAPSPETTSIDKHQAAELVAQLRGGTAAKLPQP